MSEQQIIVYIEEAQLIAQKTNNYSLYLAKMVNNSFTAIWLAKPAKATTFLSARQFHHLRAFNAIQQFARLLIDLQFA